MPTPSADFSRLISIMDDLREKCPWDKKQTIHTLRQQTIEETFELVDAITDADWNGIREELGDLLLHIVFYAKIGTEQEQFTLQEVIDGICEKLIVRHPHIYGNVTVENDEDVKRNWEQIKLKEGNKICDQWCATFFTCHCKSNEVAGESQTGGVRMAYKGAGMGKRSKKRRKELLEAIESGQQKEIEEELGDLFFSLINYSRFIQVDAENALELTNKKFIDRFTKMETSTDAKGKNLADMTLMKWMPCGMEIKKQRNKVGHY